MVRLAPCIPVVAVLLLLPSAAEAKSCGKTRLKYISGGTYTATVAKTGSVSCAAATKAVKRFGSTQRDPSGWDCGGVSDGVGKITLTCRKGRSKATARFGPL